MGGSYGPKPKTIPSWQREDTAPLVSPEDKTSRIPDKNAASNPREPLLEQATKFLENEDIRNTSIERKSSFLELKGLTEDEIADLVHEEQEEIEHAPEAEVMEDYGIDKEEVSQTQSARRLRDVSAPESPSTLSDEAPSSRKDVPPIITYPEFLIHSQKPPPLITARRLFTALYVATGAAATVYGTSKYIVEPMVESLTTARHSLFETATSNLDTLNSKLESAVSKIPQLSTQPGDDISDVVSNTSDAARFYNRSAATQTSPRLSRSTSSTSMEDLEAASACQTQENTVTEIFKGLKDIQPTDAKSPINTSIRDLRQYLDELPRMNTSQNGKLWEKSKPDEYAKLKAEIRGVKGVLLSARNFPSSAVVR